MTEIEAKFIIRRPEQVDDVLRVLADNGFSAEERGSATHVDCYFDTEDWSILAANWACRVRRRNGERKLTLKSLHRFLFRRVRCASGLETRSPTSRSWSCSA